LSSPVHIENVNLTRILLEVVLLKANQPLNQLENSQAIGQQKISLIQTPWGIMNLDMYISEILSERVGMASCSQRTESLSSIAVDSQPIVSRPIAGSVILSCQFFCSGEVRTIDSKAN